MSVPSKPSRSKTPRAKTQSAKPAKPKRRRAEKQSEASIPLADLAARKKARAAKIENCRGVAKRSPHAGVGDESLCSAGRRRRDDPCVLL